LFALVIISRARNKSSDDRSAHTHRSFFQSHLEIPLETLETLVQQQALDANVILSRFEIRFQTSFANIRATFLNSSLSLFLSLFYRPNNRQSKRHKSAFFARISIYPCLSSTVCSSVDGRYLNTPSSNHQKVLS
jgi:hypothetical protein